MLDEVPEIYGSVHTSRAFPAATAAALLAFPPPSFQRDALASPAVPPWF